MKEANQEGWGSLKIWLILWATDIFCILSQTFPSFSSLPHILLPYDISDILNYPSPQWLLNLIHRRKCKIVYPLCFTGAKVEMCLAQRHIDFKWLRWNLDWDQSANMSFKHLSSNATSDQKSSKVDHHKKKSLHNLENMNTWIGMEVWEWKNNQMYSETFWISSMEIHSGRPYQDFCHFVVS